jgi:hypothetical protein
MPRTKISEFSATAADNTDINGIDIAEGCAPSGINNAIRTLMSDLKDLQAGTSGDTIPLTAGGTGATSASTARTALGATTTGSDLFTSASASAARTVLGATTTGNSLFTAVDAAAARTAIGAGTGGGDVTTTGTQTLTSKTIAYADNTLTGVVGVTATQTLTNKTITALKETRVAMGANDIDLSAGNYFTKTITTTTTLTVSNLASSGTSNAFLLDLTDGGAGTITWFSGVKWVGGVAPTLTASGRDTLGFFTHDGGTTWSGLVLGLDIK